VSEELTLLHSNCSSEAEQLLL